MAVSTNYRGSMLDRCLPAEGELILDPEQQIYTMRKIENAVAEVNLPQMRYALRGYGAVTKTVYERTDEFEYPGKIKDETLPKFAESEYAELRHHVHGEPHKISRAGRALMYGWLARKMHPAVAMAAFWELHIGKHLQTVLADTDTEPKHYNDYKHVDDMLTSTSNEIIGDYLDMKPWLGSVGPHLGKLGEDQSLKRIYGRRERAYINGQLLIAAKDDPELVKKIEDDSDIRVMRNIVVAKTLGNAGIRVFSSVPTEVWRARAMATV